MTHSRQRSLGTKWRWGETVKEWACVEMRCASETDLSFPVNQTPMPVRPSLQDEERWATKKKIKWLRISFVSNGRWLRQHHLFLWVEEEGSPVVGDSESPALAIAQGMSLLISCLGSPSSFMRPRDFLSNISFIPFLSFLGQFVDIDFSVERVSFSFRLYTLIKAKASILKK